MFTLSRLFFQHHFNKLLHIYQFCNKKMFLLVYALFSGPTLVLLFVLVFFSAIFRFLPRLFAYLRYHESEMWDTNIMPLSASILMYWSPGTWRPQRQQRRHKYQRRQRRGVVRSARWIVRVVEGCPLRFAAAFHLVKNPKMNDIMLFVF